MDRAELKKIISEVDKLNTEADMESVMSAYHRLDDLGESHLGELIDDYILEKLDTPRTKMFERHLDSCEGCRKDLEAMRFFIKGVKDLGDDIF